MKNLVKIIIALLFVAQSNSQDLKENKLDSLLVVIKEKIKNKEFKDIDNLLEKARDISSSEKDDIKINFLQSKVFIENGEDEKSLEGLLEGFTKLRTKIDSPLYASYAKEIGCVLGRTKNYDGALKYFILGLKSAEIREDSLGISKANFHIGSTFQKKNNLDSAAYFYEDVIGFHPKKSKDKRVLASTYANLMSLSIRDSDFDLAEIYGVESLAIHTLGNDTLRMAGTLNNLGGISMYKKNLKKSNEYSFRAIELLKNEESAEAREMKSFSLDNISQILFLQGRHEEAYNYLFESTEMRYGVLTETLNSKVTEIEAKYNVAKEGEQTKIEENKRQKAEFWLYVLFVSSFILLIFLWFIYRDGKLKRKNLRLQHEQEKWQDERKIENIEIESQMKLLSATLDAKETERKDIAEILHDSVSTLLSSANMHLHAVKREFKGSVPEEISKAERIISEASDKIRNLSHKLISPVLLKFGLKSAIEDLCDKYSNSQLSFNCSFKNINRYKYNFETKIYNIIEELFNNIIKHSGANKATIVMEQLEGNLRIRIFDDGNGFDINEINKKDGLGLSQIKARVKIMKGIFDIKSSKETGTRVFINTPSFEEN